MVLAMGFSLFLMGQAASKSYPDGHGGQVAFPLGDISFADEVVNFQSGTPQAKAKKDRDPEKALGIPNYDPNEDGNFVTLGCGGILTLRFTDNVITDIPGPDLYVFEIGPAVEPTRLSISRDGQHWLSVGKISGGRAEVDISKVAKEGEFFYFVRLEDLKSACGNSQWPGADIAAVGAIGSALRFALDGSVLFDFNQYTLTAKALKSLDILAQSLAAYSGARVVVAGHTDNVGSEAYNQKLSLHRAMAVKTYLSGKKSLSSLRFEVIAFGETRPVRDNTTPTGRSVNRRVECIVYPRKL